MKIKESLSRLKTIPIHLLINLDRWLNFELLFVVVVVFFFPTSASRPLPTVSREKTSGRHILEKRQGEGRRW